MANSDKNILITPSINQSDRPSISLTGLGNSTATIASPDSSDSKLVFEYGSNSVLTVSGNKNDEAFSVSSKSGAPFLKASVNGDVEISPTSGITIINSDGLKLPGYATTCLPAGRTGLMVFDETVKRPKVYDGKKWITVGKVRDGSSPKNAAFSAKQLLKEFPGTPTGFYWIQTPGNSLPILTYCDMVTAGGGWMLVASWQDAYLWNRFYYSSKEPFGKTPLNTVSSNFGNYFLHDFRVHISTSVDITGSAATADFHYTWRGGTTWKEVWAPDDYDQYYWLSTGTNPAVPRCCLRPFDYSFNIKFNYENPNHRFNNISDYGYQNSPNATPASTGTFGGGTGAKIGYCRYWNALTKANHEFTGGYWLSYTGNFVLRESPTFDGSLAIPVKNAGTDSSGQDIDSNISVKVGRDDATDWFACATNATTAVGSGDSAASGKSMWWWLR